MKKYKDVDSLIKDASLNVQPSLRKLRTLIKKAAPNAQEGISYGMASYKLNGVLVYFMPWRSHIGFYPASSGIASFSKEVAPYKSSKGTMKFKLDEPLPLVLIEKIVKFRVKENLLKSKIK